MSTTLSSAPAVVVTRRTLDGQTQQSSRNAVPISRAVPVGTVNTSDVVVTRRTLDGNTQTSSRGLSSLTYTSGVPTVSYTTSAGAESPKVPVLRRTLEGSTQQSTCGKSVFTLARGAESPKVIMRHTLTGEVVEEPWQIKRASSTIVSSAIPTTTTPAIFSGPDVKVTRMKLDGQVVNESGAATTVSATLAPALSTTASNQVPEPAKRSGTPPLETATSGTTTTVETDEKVVLPPEDLPATALTTAKTGYTGSRIWDGLFTGSVLDGYNWVTPDTYLPSSLSYPLGWSSYSSGLPLGRSLKYLPSTYGAVYGSPAPYGDHYPVVRLPPVLPEGTPSPFGDIPPTLSSVLPASTVSYGDYLGSRYPYGDLPPARSSVLEAPLGYSAVSRRYGSSVLPPAYSGVSAYPPVGYPGTVVETRRYGSPESYENPFAGSVSRYGGRVLNVSTSEYYVD